MRVDISEAFSDEDDPIHISGRESTRHLLVKEGSDGHIIPSLTTIDIASDINLLSVPYIVCYTIRYLGYFPPPLIGISVGESILVRVCKGAP